MAKKKQISLLTTMLKHEENMFKSRPMSSINDLLKTVQDSFPAQGQGFAYARAIMNAVNGKPYQFDANLASEPLEKLLKERAFHGDHTAAILVKKMGFDKPIVDPHKTKV